MSLINVCDWNLNSYQIPSPRVGIPEETQGKACGISDLQILVSCLISIATAVKPTCKSVCGCTKNLIHP